MPDGIQNPDRLNPDRSIPLLKTLLNSFYPDKNHPRIDYKNRPDPNERVNPEVTLKELKDIIGSFSNKKKALGDDGITADILKNLPEFVLEKFHTKQHKQQEINSNCILRHKRGL